MPVPIPSQNYSTRQVTFLKIKLHPNNPQKIGTVFFLYWAILVLWQNINPGQTGTTADTLLKMILLLSMTLYFCTHKKGNFTQLPVFLVFTVSILCSFLMETAFSLRLLLHYFFPLLFAFLVLIVGGNTEMNRKQLLGFLHGVIFVVLYAALYAVIVMPHKFLSAFQVSGAYGNELSSFFNSSHEYALYLFAGAVSCLVCLELSPKLSIGKKFFYICCAVLFLVNLCLTFSRTFMLSAFCFVLLYMLINRKSSWAKWMFFAGTFGVIVIFTVPFLREYIFRILMKENNPAGRDDLAELALQVFQEAPILGKLFGSGLSIIQHTFVAEAGHRSVHNAYLQILLYFGISGLVILVLFLLSHLISCIKLTAKHRFLGTVTTALAISCVIAMMFNTATVFTSSIDSFFMTAYTIIVPRYVSNAVKSSHFS